MPASHAAAHAVRRRQPRPLGASGQAIYIIPPSAQGAAWTSNDLFSPDVQHVNYFDMAAATLVHNNLCSYSNKCQHVGGRTGPYGGWYENKNSDNEWNAEWAKTTTAPMNRLR